MISLSAANTHTFTFFVRAAGDGLERLWARFLVGVVTLRSYQKVYWWFWVFSTNRQEPVRAAAVITALNAPNRLSMITNHHKQVYYAISLCGVDQTCSIMSLTNESDVHDFP